MRKIILGLFVVLSLMSCAYAAEAKTLVVIFSRADENYSVGVVEKGNTMILAEMIANKTGAELFEVKPAKKYPVNYDECTKVADAEAKAGARPAILEDKDISEYDTIFFGYPIWWGDIPMCMYTFVEGHDWNGKKVIPFSTNEGSGAGRSESTLKKLMKGAEVIKPFTMRGSNAQKRRTDAEKEISVWLNGLGF